MSQADFWGLASTEALIQGAAHFIAANRLPSSAHPRFTFKFGRTDCSTSPTRSDVNPFPEGTVDCDDALKVFRTMGLSDDKATILIAGGHSMGETHHENSAYTGPWVGPLDTFSNVFAKIIMGSGLTTNPDGGYLNTLGRTLSNGATGTKKWIWISGQAPTRGPKGLIMLHTDVCLAWQMGPTSTLNIRENGQNVVVLGEIRGCTDRPLCWTDVGGNSRALPDSDIKRSAVIRAARDLGTFYSMFNEAWVQLLANGNQFFDGRGLYSGDKLTNACTLSISDSTC